MDTPYSKPDIESQIIYNAAQYSIMHELDDAASLHPHEAEVINGVFSPIYNSGIEDMLFNIERKAYEFNH